jgi:hypothetical protein
MAKPNRTPIPGPRQTGTIAEWKDKFGWIQPSKEIKHPNAARKGGKVYLAAEDVSEELDGIGALVSFTIYADKQGIGAADCRMAKSAAAPPPKAAAAARAGMGKSSAVAAYKATNSPAAKAKAKAAFQKPTYGKGGSSSSQVQKAAFQKNSTAAAGNRNAAKGAGKQQKNAKRETLHEEFLLGTISDWKGSFGWVTPDDTIEHPMADRHQGDLYLAQTDVEEEIDGVGAKVQYILYADRRGLGAEQVRPA